MAQVSYGTITITDTTDIDRIVNYYLATSASSGVTRSTPGWTTTVQSMTSTNQYLWNYEKIIGTGEVLISQTDPVIIGRYGQNGTNGVDGNSITSIDEYYQITNSTTNPGSSGWSTTIVNPTSSNRYLWNYQVINYSKTASEGTYADARIIGVYGDKGDPGTNGTNGINTATVYLYQRATSAPSKPSSTLTYTFSTAALTPTSSLGNWKQNIGDLTGTNPIWVIAAVASSNGTSDTIASTEWSTQVKMAQNGTDGQPGAAGAAGLNQATVYIYKRGDSAGTISPATTTYTFSSGSFTAPTNWSKTIPSTPAGKPCWVSTAVAIGNESTATLTWNTPSILVEDGSDGISPTVTATSTGVKIVDANGNETYINNGSNGQSYYTYIRYSANSDGSNMVTTPTSTTKYIGVYSGTSSTVPAYTAFTWSKYVGNDGGTGPQGVSVTQVRELYYLTTGNAPSKPTSSTTIYNDDRVGAWTSVVPEYIANGKYYISLETTLSNSSKVWSDVVLDQALTDACYNAAMAESISQSANENSQGAMSQAAAANTIAEGLQTKLKYMWANEVNTTAYPAGSYMASGNSSTFSYSDSSTYGFNSFLEHTKLHFRYNAIDLDTIGLDGLKLYSPTVSNNIITGSQLGLELTSTALKLYGGSVVRTQVDTDGLKVYNSSGTLTSTFGNSITLASNGATITVGATGTNNANIYITSSSLQLRRGTTANATLDGNGLVLSNGGLQVGTVGSNGGLYISTIDKSGIEINGYTPGTNDPKWRAIIGTKFGVDSEGNLYASNATISGAITATLLVLGSGVTIPASTGISGLSTVATTGNYNDLTSKPTMPSLTGYIYQDGTVGTTPAEGATGFVVSSSGLLQASNAIIYGSLYASKGYIGGWQIGTDNNKSLHNGNANTSPTPGNGVIILSKGITGPSTATGVLPANQTWAITASNSFGVTTAGKLYATGAEISGKMTIGSGSSIDSGTTVGGTSLSNIAQNASTGAQAASDLSAFETTVSNTYATQEALSDVEDQIPDVSGLASKTDTVKSVTTETQYRLSNSSTGLTGSGTGYTWSTTIPTWVTNTYIWTRIATTYTPITGSATTVYKPGVEANGYGIYDSQLTTALSTANTANTNANSAAATVTTTQEYRLSTSSTALNGSGTGYTWSSTIPTWAVNTYLWTRFKIEKTTVGGSTTITYTPGPSDKEYGIYDSALTTALSSAAAAQTSVNSAVKSTVSCYYRSSTQSTPSINASTSIGTSNNVDNAWEYVMPIPKRGCYFYTCEEYTPVSGTKTYSTVRELSSETYASKWVSSNDSTYIDGGKIYANSITADQIAGNTITIGNINQSDSSTSSAILNSALADDISDASYSVEIEVRGINYTTPSATLFAHVYHLGTEITSSTTPAISSIAFQWKKVVENPVGTYTIQTINNQTNQTLSVSGAGVLDTTYICEIDHASS